MQTQTGKSPYFDRAGAAREDIYRAGASRGDLHRAGAARGVLPLLITGIIVVLFSTAGFARMMGWGPGSTGESGDILALDQVAPSKCPECSVIVSMREIAGRDADSDRGAEGSMTAGDQVGLRVAAVRRYEITIRQSDRSDRVINLASSARWRPGERVIVIDGAPPSNR